MTTLDTYISATSHGMFSLPWSISGRNEKVLQEKTNITPQPSSLSHLPLFNKMKRKRGSSSPVPPGGSDSSSLKSRTETMSHIEIPSFDIQRATPPVETQRVNEDRLFDSPGAIRERLPVGMNGPGSQENCISRDHSAHTAVVAEKNGHGNVEQVRSSPTAVSLPALQRSIESILSHAILIKHGELRLIDQEFAKCQIALEQLRRCQVIPYPAMSSNMGDRLAASGGSGPVFNNKSTHAPPWGVTNGPYTRHYERWLIPDLEFGDAIVEAQARVPVGETVSERPTRGSKAEMGALANNSRSQRGSNNTQLKALPHGYPEEKKEDGPVIVKRPSDGRMVKLVCLNDRRTNFKNVQGFINHCRISHARQFASHDAAIEACGEEVDAEMEVGTGEVPQGTSSATLVHPLIRSAHLLRPVLSVSMPSLSRRTKPQSSAASSTHSPTQSPVPPTTSTPRPQSSILPKPRDTPTISFNPSPQAPHLSALFARAGRGGDLDQMVREARTRPDVDITLISDDEEDDGVDEARGEAPQESYAQSRNTQGMRGGYRPVGAFKSNPQSVDRLINDGNHIHRRQPENLPHITRRPAYPSSYSMHTREHREDHDPDHSMLDVTSPLDLSPNTTDPHPAPSLVFDDDDYENAHSDFDSPSSAGAEEDDDRYVEADMMDHDDMELGEGSSLTLPNHEKAHGPNSGRRSSAMRDPAVMQEEAFQERHVSFANPGQQMSRGSAGKDGQQ